jgi:hypothetical protein
MCDVSQKAKKIKQVNQIMENLALAVCQADKMFIEAFLVL